MRSRGDAFVQDGEECDLGRMNGGRSSCTARCTLGFCGDGHLQYAEQCDDGSDVGDPDDHGCTEDCLLPSCGNGELDGKEECDDGNLSDRDDCTAACQQNRCGDGIVQLTSENGSFDVEECDDGNSIDDDGCDDECLVSEAR